MKKEFKKGSGKKMHAVQSLIVEPMKCCECDKVFNNAKAIERASTEGCSSCGAIDSLIPVASHTYDPYGNNSD